jgi:hypothetical protein
LCGNVLHELGFGHLLSSPRFSRALALLTGIGAREAAPAVLRVAAGYQAPETYGDARRC